MTIDAATSTRSRRTLLAGIGGGLAAWAAASLGRVSPVRAGVDGDVVLGNSNSATNTTRIDLTEPPSIGYDAFSAHTTRGTGVVGTSVDSDGVSGFSDNAIGVKGTGNAGVWGETLSGGTGVFGSGSPAFDDTPMKSKTGVYGLSEMDATSVGVWGKSMSGRGVTGEATGGIGVRALATNGTGIYATATTGVALRATGKVKFDNCIGVATIAAGNSSVIVNPGVDLTTSSVVVLTPQADPGTRRMWATIDATANAFTIHLSSTVSGSLKVAWHAFG